MMFRVLYYFSRNRSQLHHVDYFQIPSIWIFVWRNVIKWREMENRGRHQKSWSGIGGKETEAGRETAIPTKLLQRNRCINRDFRPTPCIRNSRVFVGKVSASRYANTRPLHAAVCHWLPPPWPLRWIIKWTTRDLSKEIRESNRFGDYGGSELYSCMKL